MEDEVLQAHHTQRLLEILDELEVIYGRIPSILDTRADYTDDPLESIALYKEALAACEDPLSPLLILPSLIHLLIQEQGDESSILNYVLELERLTDTDQPSYELKKLREIQAEFEEFRKGKSGRGGGRGPGGNAR